MKWIKTNDNSTTEQFELWESDKKIANLSFTTGTRIGRFASALSKRLFYIDTKGLLQTKAILRNEYGVKIGKLQLENQNASKGYLEIDGKRYLYTYNQDIRNEFKVFDDATNANLITCAIPSHYNTPSTKKPLSFLQTKLPSLFLVLCWHALQSAQLTAK